MNPGEVPVLVLCPPLREVSCLGVPCGQRLLGMDVIREGLAGAPGCQRQAG